MAELNKQDFENFKSSKSFYRLKGLLQYTFMDI